MLAIRSDFANCAQKTRRPMVGGGDAYIANFTVEATDDRIEVKNGSFVQGQN